MKPRQVSVLFVFLLIVAITRADNQKPSVPLPHISKQTRIDLVRAFNAELVYIRSPFPMGKKGLMLKDGKLSPAGGELEQMIAMWGPAAKPGDQARISGIIIKEDRKSTRLNSSHSQISYAVFCLKKKTTHN